MKKKYGFQEHDISKKFKNLKVAGINTELLSLGAEYAGLEPADDDVFGCDYAVVHWDKNERDIVEQKWMKLSSDCLHDTIFMLGSSGGREKLAQENHQCLKVIKNGQTFSCYLLIIKNYSPFSESRCVDAAKSFFTLTISQAESIYNSQFSGIPDIVREIFSVPQVIEALSALCVLCQGFLAVWRVVPGAEIKVDSNNDIGKALNLMCWDEAPQGIYEGIKERFAGFSQEKLSIDILREPLRENIFQNTDLDIVVAQIKKELSMCNSNNKAGQNNILTLVRFIFGKMIPTDDIPEMVAKAYISIHGALESE